MRSHLTKRVFQRLLQNEPLLHRGCTRSLYINRTRPLRAITRPVQSQFQRRTVWWGWLTNRPRRVMKPQKIDPGLDVLAEQETFLELGVRKYTNEELVGALQEYIQHKHDTKTPILDTQITAVLATYKHLMAERVYDEKALTTIQDAVMLLTALRSDLRHSRLFIDDNVESFKVAADLVFQDINTRKSEWPVAEEAIPDVENAAPENAPQIVADKPLEFIEKCALKYLDVLSYRLKAGLRTRDVFMELVKEYPSFGTNSKFSRAVVWALAYNKNHVELDEFLQFLRTIDESLPDNVWDGIIMGSVAVEDIQTVKKWFERRPKGDPNAQRPELELLVLKLCIMKGELEWGHIFLDQLVGRQFSPRNKSWQYSKMSMLLTWAMASGRSVDELDTMLDVLCNRLQLDLRTRELNPVLEMAKIKNDPYYAERLFGLIRRRGLQFDATTYKLELEWRLLAGDIAGAQASYNKLRRLEFDVKEVSPAINQLILAQLAREPVPYDEVMDLVSELTESDGRFSAELVAALSKLHLDRGELHDLADLLHTYAPSFTTAERGIVSTVFEDYIFSQESSGAKWDAYAILKAVFPELSKEKRLAIMEEFFKVQRHDLGMHVFGHMRSAQIKDRRPDAKAYAQLFHGLAFQRNFKALEVANNMLRLDTEVEPDTAIKTALMLAYTLADKAARAIALWDEIMYIREGPSYESINIALRTCQKLYGGLQRANEIWAQLKKQDVEIPKETADSYIAALSAQGQIKAAIDVVSNMESITGGSYKADAVTILAVINPGEDHRDAALTWAGKTYPHFMDEIIAAGKSPLERRFLVSPLLPKDGSYKGYWSFISAQDWELEYVDWQKMRAKMEAGEY